jgi:hypothetical protein
MSAFSLSSPARSAARALLSFSRAALSAARSFSSSRRCAAVNGSFGAGLFFFEFFEAFFGSVAPAGAGFEAAAACYSRAAWRQRKAAAIAMRVAPGDAGVNRIREFSADAALRSRPSAP